MVSYSKYFNGGNDLKNRVTVKDLAKLCGVSIGTVDRAINDRGGINPETKKKILDAAREYGFVKNQNALSLSLGKPNLIGVIITDLKNEFQCTLLTAIEARASKLGYSTLIMLSNYDGNTEYECANRMRSMNVAGLIVLPVTTDVEFYKGIINSGIPVVTVGNKIENIPFVGIDDYEAMKCGVEYVLSRGYEKLIYTAPLLERESFQNMSAQSLRRDGFYNAVYEKADFLLLDNYADYESFLEKLRCGGYSENRKTAFICPSDVYTADCLPLIGKKFGIMGFDRLTTIGKLIPNLAGIIYPTAEIGCTAVDLLFEPENKIFEFEIFRGESV